MGKDFDDVEVEYRHRVAHLVWRSAVGHPQAEARVGRHHQLLERPTASYAAAKTA